MKGTQHFSRMNYHVRRGMREIVAPTHRIQKTVWAEILKEFSHRCAYCCCEASADNRGIVPDHLVAVTEFGELVSGNTIPACQSCNDSRGNKDWRSFVISRFPIVAAERIEAIERHIQKHNYIPRTPESALTGEELVEYNEVILQWENLLSRAQALQSAVAKRREQGGS